MRAVVYHPENTGARWLILAPGLGDCATTVLPLECYD